LIPIAGVIRSLKLKELGRGPKRAGVRITVLFLAPILGALIYYVTYPSTFLAMPLAVAVLAGAILFFYLAR
jgi:zinc transporter ZupT